MPSHAGARLACRTRPRGMVRAPPCTYSGGWRECVWEAQYLASHFLRSACRGARTKPVDTLPHACGGCSGEWADEMTASIAAAYDVKGLPGPRGRGVHRDVAWCGVMWRDVAWVAHCEPPLRAHGTQVQDVFVLVPTGTAYRGTPEMRLRWQGAQCPTQRSVASWQTRKREVASHRLAQAKALSCPLL